MNRRTNLRTNIKDGVLHHPFELSICATSYFLIWTIVDLLVTNRQLLHATEHGFLSLPIFILWVWCVMGTIGTSLIIAGLGMSMFSRAGRAIEAAGLWLVMAMWASVAISVVAFGSSRISEYGSYLAISIACGFRILALNQIQKVLNDVGRIDE